MLVSRSANSADGERYALLVYRTLPPGLRVKLLELLLLRRELRLPPACGARLGAAAAFDVHVPCGTPSGGRGRLRVDLWQVSAFPSGCQHGLLHVPNTCRGIHEVVPVLLHDRDQ